MVTISKSLVVSLTVALSVGAVAARADGTATLVMKPGKGVSLDVGSKRAAGYFMAGTNTCDLTLMFADRPDADGHVSGDTTRLNVPVASGSRTRVYTTDGSALEVSCGLSAAVMSLRVLALTANVTK